MSAAQDKEKAALEKKKQLEKAKDKPMDEQDLVKHYEEKASITLFFATAPMLPCSFLFDVREWTVGIRPLYTFRTS